MTPRTRREFIAVGIGGVATVALGATVWRELLAEDSTGVSGGTRAFSYGPRGAPDANGIRLPEGFQSRVIARGGQVVPGADYSWHEASDGMATFPTDDGGWILVSNSETEDGGASAIRFDADGEIADAYRILDGTEQNCSGGGTPWGTWLSCEEVEHGSVWECDPTGRRKAVRRPAMGTFQHEAAAVDPRGRRIYMTEDLEDGGFYRFTPDSWPDLSSGLLEIAIVDGKGGTTWHEVPDPGAAETPTREQVDGSTAFERGEGIWLDGGTVFVATTSDNRVHAYDVARQRFEILYDGADREEPLLHVDQMTATSAGEIFVCENSDADEMDVGLLSRDGKVAKFLSITGPEHEGSEPTGVIFDPRERRMYVASQRAGEDDEGAIYEISGPFRTASG
ncbi:MAG TPA: alkaline phosphatase PhoX [Thermoleophilaceae bacterium]|nr:alkaline phosphatase PhoX [Thermoleophilaceae bacterium]